MTALPTLDVSTEESERILSAFGSEQIYLAWLKDAIRNKVAAAEVEALSAQQASDRQAVVNDVMENVLP